MRGMKKQQDGSVQEKTEGALMKDRLKSVPTGCLCPTFFSSPVFFFDEYK